MVPFGLTCCGFRLNKSKSKTKPQRKQNLNRIFVDRRMELHTNFAFHSSFSKFQQEKKPTKFEIQSHYLPSNKWQSRQFFCRRRCCCSNDNVTKARNTSETTTAALLHTRNAIEKRSLARLFVCWQSFKWNWMNKKRLKKINESETEAEAEMMSDGGGAEGTVIWTVLAVQSTIANDVTHKAVQRVIILFLIKWIDKIIKTTATANASSPPTPTSALRKVNGSESNYQPRVKIVCIFH